MQMYYVILLGVELIVINNSFKLIPYINYIIVCLTPSVKLIHSKLVFIGQSFTERFYKNSIINR